MIVQTDSWVASEKGKKQNHNGSTNSFLEIPNFERRWEKLQELFSKIKPDMFIGTGKTGWKKRREKKRRTRQKKVSVASVENEGERTFFRAGDKVLNLGCSVMKG